MHRRHRDHGGGAWLLAAALVLGGCERGTPGPTTRQEAQRIARSLTRVVGPPAGGWALSRTRAGAPVLQLRGRLQEVMIAGQAADGSLRTTCVSSAQEAERFLAPAVPAGSPGNEGGSAAAVPSREVWNPSRVPGRIER